MTAATPAWWPRRVPGAPSGAGWGWRSRWASARCVASGGLLATSGYLISRAAQHPPVLALSVAIVAVRAFAISRALLRYSERLASHDAALRLLGRVRANFYRRLAPLVPGDLGGGGQWRRSAVALRGGRGCAAGSLPARAGAAGGGGADDLRRLA